MHLYSTLAVLAQGPPHECDATRYGCGIQSEQLVILRKDIFNPHLGVQGPDNLDERLPESFIDAIVPALVGSGKSGLVDRCRDSKPVEELLVPPKA